MKKQGSHLGEGNAYFVQRWFESVFSYQKMLEERQYYEEVFTDINNDDQGYYINTQRIDYLLSNAEKVQKLKIDVHTMYVLDISQEIGNANTLVFHAQKGILQTKQKANSLMDAYFKKCFFSYQKMRQLGSLWEIQYACPYVCGEMIFVPETGAVRQQTNWIAVHHLEDFTEHEGTDNAIIHFYKSLSLYIPLSYPRLTNQLQRAKLLFENQKSLLLESLYLFSCLEINFDSQDWHFIQKIELEEIYQKKLLSFRHFMCKYENAICETAEKSNFEKEFLYVAEKLKKYHKD